MQENQTPSSQASQQAPSAGTGNNDRSNQAWERDVLTRLAMSAINEQRRSRRWRIFFVSLAFIYFGFLLLILAQADRQDVGNGQHTAVVDVSGVIAAGSPANADAVISGLRDAFEHQNTAGVILRINSPGGSPVQSGYVYEEMVRLRKKYPDIPLYAVIEDVGASGGYYIAAGAEKIYADKASIVGSIGVRMDSFGFVGAMDKIGIERRLLTAGDSKGLLDPFLPEDETAKVHLQGLLNNVHEQFIQAVKSQRGERLLESADTFSGLIWTGEKSVSLGLIDELGNVSYVAREVVGEEKIRNFTYQEDWVTRFSRELGANLALAITAMLQPKLQ